MATTSFEKDFTVTDKEVIQKLKRATAHPRKISIKKRDYKSDESEGINLLRRKLSNLEN